MERNLTRFIRALRSAGADISTAEAIDAAQVLALVGFHDREVMKTSLGVALAKSEEEKILHDQLFEQYFSAPAHAPPAPPRETAKSDDAQSGDESSEQSQGSGESPSGEGQQKSGQSSGGGGSEPARGRPSPGDFPDLQELAESGDAGRIATAIARAGAATGVDDIRFQSQTAYFVRRMMSSSAWKRWRTACWPACANARPRRRPMSRP